MSLDRAKQRHILFAGVFFLLSALYFSNVLFRNSTLIVTSPGEFPPWSDQMQAGASNNLMRDNLLLTFPWRTFNSEALRKGEIPLWNPYIFCGVPHFALIQSNSLYPLTFPFDWIEPIKGMAVSMALHFALAGLLMYWWLLKIDLPVEAALLGGILFEFNGMFLVRLSAPSYVFSGVWLPLLLIGVEYILWNRKMYGAAAIAFAVLLSFLGGHPQIFVLMCLMGALYLFYRLLLQKPGWKAASKACSLFIVGIFTGLALASFQLLPFLELVRHSAREAQPFSSYRDSALPLVALVQGILPDVFGHPVDKTYWLTKIDDLLRSGSSMWGLNYSGQNLFTGIVPLVLGAVAVLKRRCAYSLFFALTALFSISVLIGTPVLNLVYWFVPTFQFSRPDRVIYLYMASVSILGALGYAQLVRSDDQQSSRNYRAILFVTAGLLLLMALMPFIVNGGLRSGYHQWWMLAWNELCNPALQLSRQMLLAFVEILLCVMLILWQKRKASRLGLFFWIVLAFVPMFFFGRHFNPVQPLPLLPRTGLEDVLHDKQHLSRIVRIMGHKNQEFFPSNIPQAFGVFDVNGENALVLENYQDLVASMDASAISRDKYFSEFTNRRLAGSKVLDLLNVEFILSNLNLSLPIVWRSVSGNLKVYRNPDYLPRVFLVNQVEFYQDQSQGVLRLMDKTFNPGEVALLEGHGEVERPKAESGRVFRCTTRMVHYSDNEFELETETSEDAILVSSEVYYPGWRVMIDGKSSPILLVDTAFRGARVPAGKHVVRMEYKPLSFKLGAVISLLAGTVLAGCFVASLRRRSSRDAWVKRGHSSEAQP